jgi:predicted oxidoreductase
MKTYHIPQTELQVSRLSYGTWHLGGSWDKTSPTPSLLERAERLLLTAVESGINLIDLADIYTMGKSDMLVGQVLARHPHLRPKIYLQAKCGIILGADPDRGGPGRYDFSYDHIIEAVNTSLQRLQTDYVDILALHRPDPLMEPEEVARACDDLHQSGKVRYFGVSNHTAAQIALLQKHLNQPLIVNQVELNLLHHQLIDDGIVANTADNIYTGTTGTLDYCRLHDMLIQAWSPVAGGRLFAPPQDAPKQVQDVAQIITELAEKHQAPPEAIALAWLLRHPAPIQPIIGTLNPARLRRSARADEVILSRPEWYRLFIAARGKAVP